MRFLDAIKKPFVIKRLKKEYKMLYGSTAAEAEQSLQRQLHFMKTKNPANRKNGISGKLFTILKKTADGGGGNNGRELLLCNTNNLLNFPDKILKTFRAITFQINIRRNFLHPLAFSYTYFRIPKLL